MSILPLLTPFTFVLVVALCLFFFFNDTATTEIYTLSLHDALPIAMAASGRRSRSSGFPAGRRMRASRSRSRRARRADAWPMRSAPRKPGCHATVIARAWTHEHGATALSAQAGGMRGRWPQACPLKIELQQFKARRHDTHVDPAAAALSYMKDRLPCAIIIFLHPRQ